MSAPRMTLTFALLLCVAGPALAQESEGNAFSKIPWETGPVLGDLGAEAKVAVPDDCVFTGAEGTRQFMELNENPTSGIERGTVLCRLVDGNGETEATWFAVFEFDDSGYVKDNEKSSLDADAILATLKEGDQHGNRERKERGWSAIYLDGWADAPHYDDQTKNLTWATRLHDDEESQVLNHSVRLLGRGGVMSVDLVVSPEHYQRALPAFNGVIGSSSTAARPTPSGARDKIAAYGLTALSPAAPARCWPRPACSRSSARRSCSPSRRAWPPSGSCSSAGARTRPPARDRVAAGGSELGGRRGLHRARAARRAPAGSRRSPRLERIRADGLAPSGRAGAAPALAADFLVVADRSGPAASAARERRAPTRGARGATAPGPPPRPLARRLGGRHAPGADPRPARRHGSASARSVSSPARPSCSPWGSPVPVPEPSPCAAWARQRVVPRSWRGARHSPRDECWKASSRPRLPGPRPRRRCVRWPASASL